MALILQTTKKKLHLSNKSSQAKISLKRGKQGKRVALKQLTIYFLLIGLVISCNLRPPRIWPPPPQLHSLEGYASLSIKNSQQTVRSKFSFFFYFPGDGLLDVSNFLGRTLYQIIITQKRAFFLVPSKKIYWQGEEEEIIDKFLGFRLNVYELMALLSGQWTKIEIAKEGGNWRQEWLFEKDKQGRIVSGRRGQLEFEVQEFFKNTSVIRRLVFHHPWNSGHLKILSLRFNQPLKKQLFSLALLSHYQQKSWAEIEKILNEKS